MPLSYNEQTPEVIVPKPTLEPRPESFQDIKAREEFKKKRKFLLLTLVFGIVGTIVPWFSTTVARYGGVTPLSLMNSAMLLILSMLVIMFLVSRIIFAVMSKNNKVFLFSIIFLFLSLVSFVLNLILYITLTP